MVRIAWPAISLAFLLTAGMCSTAPSHSAEAPAGPTLLGVNSTVYTQPAVVQSASVGATNAQSATVTIRPPKAGNVVYCAVAQDGVAQGSISRWPAGFASLKSVSVAVAPSVGVSIARRIVQSGDSGAYTVSFTSAYSHAVLACMELAYVNTSAPELAADSNATGISVSNLSTSADTLNVPGTAIGVFASMNSGSASPINAISDIDAAVGPVLLHVQHAGPLATGVAQSSSVSYASAAHAVVGVMVVVAPLSAPVSVSASTPSPTPSASPTPTPTATPTATPSPTPNPTPTPTPTATPPGATPTPSPTPTPTPTPRVYTGTIDALGTNEFHAQFGTGCGFDWATYNSSTTFTGAALAIGDIAQVTTFSSCAGPLAAISVNLTAPTPAPTASPTPTPVPTANPSVPAHVKTAIYGYGYAGVSASVPLSFQAKYVTWAYSQESSAASYRAAGISEIVYSNFWRCYTSDNPLICYNDLKPGGTYAAAEAKDCSGNVLTDSSYGGGYQNDPRNTSPSLGLANATAGYRTGEYTISGVAQYDAVYADDTDTIIDLNGTPCGYTASAWISATSNILSQMPYKFFVNSLANTSIASSQISQSVSPTNVLGGQCESCFLSTTPVVGSTWQAQENTAIAVVALHKIFWDYAKGSSSTTAAQRIYAYASFLLSYDPSYSLYQLYSATTSSFMVFPEAQVVPIGPNITATSSVSSYSATGGAYVRAWSTCYQNQIPIGGCMAAVNSGTTTVSVPISGYTHALVLTGSDLYDGGSAAFTGPCSGTLAPGTAEICSP